MKMVSLHETQAKLHNTAPRCGSGFKRPAAIRARRPGIEDAPPASQNQVPEIDPPVQGEGALISAQEFTSSQGGLSADSIAADVASLLADKELTREAVEAMSETPEWKGYDQHVTFEMNLLRTRYVGGDEPLTNARRAQMSAHLKQVKDSIMDQHLDQAAAAFVASATDADKERLLGMMDALADQGMDYDAAAAGVDAELPKAPVDLQESLQRLSSLMADVESRADGGPGASPTADLNRALDEIGAEMGLASREEMLDAVRDQGGKQTSGNGRSGR